MELLQTITVTLQPGLESIQKTLIIEACVTAILLLLLVLLTLIPTAHVILERIARNTHAKQRMYGFKSSSRKKTVDPELSIDDDDDEEKIELLNNRKSNHLASMSTF